MNFVSLSDVEKYIYCFLPGTPDTGSAYWSELREDRNVKQRCFTKGFVVKKFSPWKETLCLGDLFIANLNFFYLFLQIKITFHETQVLVGGWIVQGVPKNYTNRFQFTVWPRKVKILDFFILLVMQTVNNPLIAL